MYRRSPISTAVEYYRKLKETEFIEVLSAEELKANYSRKDLVKYIDFLSKLRSEVLSADLYPHHRKDILAKIDRRLSKLKVVLSGGKETPMLEILIEADKSEVFEEEVAKISCLLVNNYFREAKVILSLEGVGVSFPKGRSYTIYLAPGEKYSLEIPAVAEKTGEATIGPIVAEATFSDGKRINVKSKLLKIKVKPYRPMLEVVRRVKSKNIREGKPAEVEIILRNVGTTALGVSVVEPIEGMKIEGKYKWRGVLKPGEEKILRYKIHLPSGSHTLPSTKVIYRDPRGSTWEKLLKEEVIEVKPAKAEEINYSSLIDLFFKSAFSAGVGYLVGKYIVGKKLPEIKKYSKPVFVQGNIPWKKIEVKGQEITIVFEHPIATVTEDRGSYIALRPATLEEILSATDIRLARTLQLEFCTKVENIFKYWRPRLGEEVNLSYKKINLSKEEKEAIRKELEAKREVINEKKLSMLPENTLLEFIYYTGSFFRRKEFAIHVLTYSRLRKLFYNEIDHKPLAKAEALKAIEKRIRKDIEHVLILASPTGWDQKSIEEVESFILPNSHILLVDLKTGEAYFNKNDPIACEVASLIAKETTGLPPIPKEARKEFDKLTEMLVKGEINEKEYLNKILELLGVKIKVKEKAKQS